MRAPLQRQVQRYLTVACGDSQVFTVDAVLALLRINTQESLREAERIIGKPITVCPPGIPPWPPKPVVVSSQGPRIIRVVRNPCLPTTPAFQRFKSVRVGMTETQLLSRGVTKRDLRRWKKLNYLEVSCG